eukprot:SAG31_NODE_543_length_14248_cov_3.230900_2_plen_105_part_00
MVSRRVQKRWQQLRETCQHIPCAQLCFVSKCLAAAADVDPKAYSSRTLQNVFSSGKNLEAIAVMVLVDRGLVQYTDCVADHWPAFGLHGKETITVEDVLRHVSL